MLVLRVASLQGKVVQEKVLQLIHLTKCTYEYEVTVYTARGAKSTLSDGYQVHALVRYSSVTLRTKIANASFMFTISRTSHIPASFKKRRMKIWKCSGKRVYTYQLVWKLSSGA